MSQTSVCLSLRAAVAAAALLAACAAGAAAPELGRATVTATADRDQNRILVRWQFVEGGKAYPYFDVLRRPANGGAFLPLNDDPVGPASTVAAVRAVFEDTDNADALAWILADHPAPQEDYAARILQILAEQDEPELTMLPDRNFAAALAMGMGWMDEAVTPGQAYVYEVWGLDAQGFRVERLGRASAVAGAPDPPSAPTGLGCVDAGGQPADRVVFVRWGQGTERPGFGYDVWRSPYDGFGCPADLSGAPGAIRVNAAPVQRDAPGEVRRGEKTFQGTCASCHATREDPPLRGKTPDDWRRSVDPDFSPVAAHTPIAELSAEDLEAVFDYIGEFQFADDADDTLGGPLATGSFWCYQALNRDLLGQTWAQPAGGPAAPTALCEVMDRKRPLPPHPLRAEREPTGPDTETCKVTWTRNGETDVVQYRLYRTADAAPKMTSAATTPSVVQATVPEPGSGTEASWIDPGVSPAEFGRTFFYSARAVDASGNVSDFSAWSPCAPRDLIPPAPPTLTTVCCSAPGDCTGSADPDCCADLGQDGRWSGELGGDDVVRSDSRQCPVAVLCSGPDVAYCQVFRSFDGEEFLPGPTFEPGQPFEVGFDASVDTKMEIEVVAYDASGNASGKSPKKKSLQKGKKSIPPPIITKIAFTNPATGEAKVRFRSIQPNALLGFALYRQSVPASQVPPALDYGSHFLVQLPAGNLGGTPYTTAPDIEWVVQPGTQALSKIAVVNSSWVPPAAGDYLVYIDDQKTYEMRTVVGNDPDAVFRLSAIGWTGKQSATKPFRWGGWNMGDLALDWPTWRTRNAPGTPASATALATAVGAGYVDLQWNPWPLNVAPDERPFVVYRRRGTSPNWKQLSPAFRAVSTGALTYRDVDVENCFEYDYTVVRLGPDGEFDVQYDIEHVAYACSPQP